MSNDEDKIGRWIPVLVVVPSLLLIGVYWFVLYTVGRILIESIAH